MNFKLQPWLSLAVCAIALQACGTTEQRDSAPASLAAASDTQASAQAISITPVEIKAKAPEVLAPASSPVQTPAVENKGGAEQASKAGEAQAPVARIDRYTVVSGDTLAGIAARKEVYGDARLWPFLYRSNVNQIGQGGLIFPNQVLIVDRAYTPADVAALIGGTKGLATSPPNVANPAQQLAAAQSKSAPAKQAVVSSIPRQPSSPPAAKAPNGAAEPEKLTLADFLAGARAAFAAGDSPWAIYYYSVYLQRKNTDAAAWGELGNVQYLDGNYAEASRAFYNAANLLIDRGQTARALDLIPAIEEGDPSLAEALHQRLTTVRQ